MRQYIIEKADGDWNIFTSTPLKEAMKRIPKVRNGHIELGGKTYVVDPHRFRRIAYRPKRFLKMVTEYCYVQIWKDNDPEPVDLFSLEGTSPYISGDIMSQLSRSERLRHLVSPQTDWIYIALLLLIVSNVAMAGMLYLTTKA